MAVEKDKIIEPSKTREPWWKSLILSSSVGAVVALAYHWWDRAAYLALLNKRSFFRRENFVNPYHGWKQTLTYRPLTSGLFFFLQARLEHSLYPQLKAAGLSEKTANFLVGTLTGGTEGAVKTIFNNIKFNTWRTENATFLSSVHDLVSQRGPSSLFIGIWATVIRDMIFGGVYQERRSHYRARMDLHLGKMKKMTKEARSLGLDGQIYNFVNPLFTPTQLKVIYYLPCDIEGGMEAAVACSPVNYIRAIKQNTNGDEAPSTRKIIENFVSEVKEKNTIKDKAAHVSRSMGWGIGTLRVGLGMASSQALLFTIPLIHVAKIEPPTLKGFSLNDDSVDMLLHCSP